MPLPFLLPFVGGLLSGYNKAKQQNRDNAIQQRFLDQRSERNRLQAEELRLDLFLKTKQITDASVKDVDDRIRGIMARGVPSDDPRVQSLFQQKRSIQSSVAGAFVTDAAQSGAIDPGQDAAAEFGLSRPPSSSLASPSVPVRSAPRTAGPSQGWGGQAPLPTTPGAGIVKSIQADKEKSQSAFLGSGSQGVAKVFEDTFAEVMLNESGEFSEEEKAQVAVQKFLFDAYGGETVTPNQKRVVEEIAEPKIKMLEASGNPQDQILASAMRDEIAAINTTEDQAGDLQAKNALEGQAQDSLFADVDSGKFTDALARAGTPHITYTPTFSDQASGKLSFRDTRRTDATGQRQLNSIDPETGDSTLDLNNVTDMSAFSNSLISAVQSGGIGSKPGFLPSTFANDLAGNGLGFMDAVSTFIENVPHELIQDPVDGRPKMVFLEDPYAGQGHYTDVEIKKIVEAVNLVDNSTTGQTNVWGFSSPGRIGKVGAVSRPVSTNEIGRSAFTAALDGDDDAVLSLLHHRFHANPDTNIFTDDEQFQIRKIIATVKPDMLNNEHFINKVHQVLGDEEGDKAIDAAKQGEAKFQANERRLQQEANRRQARRVQGSLDALEGRVNQFLSGKTVSEFEASKAPPDPPVQGPAESTDPIQGPVKPPVQGP